VSANVSYERSVEDILVLTGLKVSRGSQHRLVHRQNFELPVAREKTHPVEELSIDGGKVRIRTPLGESCRWQDYKAVNLHEHDVAAFFQSNETLIAWVNSQKLSSPVTCLGDGHDGIWNIVSGIRTLEQRREILDWYHLRENLYKVGGSQQRLTAVETLLWRGDIDAAIEQFQGWQHERVETFIAYLNHHRSRIVHYDYFQAEGISIGSGAIESTVKQIGGRLKLSGAQWNAENVPQVLLHRCAYLNGQFSS
jgi:hypothetical protein